MEDWGWILFPGHLALDRPPTLIPDQSSPWCTQRRLPASTARGDPIFVHTPSWPPWTVSAPCLFMFSRVADKAALLTRVDTGAAMIWIIFKAKHTDNAWIHAQQTHISTFTLKLQTHKFYYWEQSVRVSVWFSHRCPCPHMRWQGEVSANRVE